VPTRSRGAPERDHTPEGLWGETRHPKGCGEKHDIWVEVVIPCLEDLGNAAPELPSEDYVAENYYVDPYDPYGNVSAFRLNEAYAARPRKPLRGSSPPETELFTRLQSAQRVTELPEHLVRRLHLQIARLPGATTPLAPSPRERRRNGDPRQPSASVAKRAGRLACTPRPHEKAKRPEPATTTENQDALSHNDSVGPARPASSAVVP